MTATEAGRVLIVEDDPDLRDVFAAALEDEGYAVDVAPEGAAALAKLRPGAELPCVLVLDLRMPGMNGWELAERLRASERLRSVPIVVVAAHYLLADEARRIGATSWLQKPVSLGTLVAAIGDACHSGTSQAD